MDGSKHNEAWRLVSRSTLDATCMEEGGRTESEIVSSSVVLVVDVTHREGA